MLQMYSKEALSVKKRVKCDEGDVESVGGSGGRKRARSLPLKMNEIARDRGKRGGEER